MTLVALILLDIVYYITQFTLINSQLNTQEQGCCLVQIEQICIY